MSESAETQSALARRRAGAARKRVLSAAQKGIKWRVSAARRRAGAARKRVIKWKVSAARRRAGTARERVLSAAQKRVKWKIVRFFAQPTIAAWTALWYILLSLIGVIYSLAFYSRFYSVHIFDFFDTPDFLLSALRDMKMLVIGVVATLISIGIPVYRFYNSSIYSAYKFGGDKRRKEQESRIKQEAASLLFVSWLLTFLIFYLWVTSSYFLWEWDRSEPSISIRMVSLYLVSAIAPVPFVYCFYRLLRNVSRGDRITLGSRLFAVVLLAEAILILPFLSGVSDSKAALKDEERRVRVTLRQDGASPNIPPPDRTLLLGTTSSFHFFYECGEALIDKNGVALKNKDERLKKCENGRPFIIPTANIASLEFNPKKEKKEKKEEKEVSPHVGLPNVVAAIAAIKESSRKDTNKITKELKNLNKAVVANPNIVQAINTLNQTVSGFNPPIVVIDPGLDGVTEAVNNHTNKITKELNSNTTEISAAIKGLNISCGGQPPVQPPGQPPVQGHCPQGWKKVTTIWPFPKEEHELEQNSDGQKQLNALFIEMEKKFAESTLGQLILVGRSDARPVCKQTLALYGSSSGLAQGRAKWIWDELVKKFTTPEQKKALQERTLLLSAGPLYVRGEASEMNRAKDRSVEVWACWTPKPTSPSADSPVRKGQTGD